MGPGQRKYIEGRIADFDQRARWLRQHAHEDIEWINEELPVLEAKITSLRAKLELSGAASL